ncbi:hypothetical protein CBR_g11111 [Chara braunii]|uniref:peptidylprolyl isomerase n=1 Tax=Chara braunii TaxID=69332 RepID=A0A388KQA0_CHABU|nr:hypothetical protein CBR_g11111 [Chara braunii]|eukprot:GBG72178.1 hypothetical protein CBR_g11111 [Chara braunii]
MEDDLKLDDAGIKNMILETAEAGDDRPITPPSGEDLDISGDGGVKKRIIRTAKPHALQVSESLPLVDVAYEGRLAATGEIFDTTRDDNTVFSFEVGRGKVIRAWDLGLRTMKVGEVALLTCSPDYAYGKAGSPPDIPPDATLIFEIELLAARPPKGTTADLATQEREKLQEIRRERELAAAKKEEEKKKREEARAAAAARLQAKLDAKKGGGKKGGAGKSGPKK